MMYESVYDLDNSAKHFHHFHHFILSFTIVTNLHNTPSTQLGVSETVSTLSIISTWKLLDKQILLDVYYIELLIVFNYGIKNEIE